MIDIALYEPEIPPNTGNIIRLCANAGANLHLIHPLGFHPNDKQLQRAGLDYHEWTKINHHQHFTDFRQTAAKSKRLFAASTHGTIAYTDVEYQKGDILLFGPETRGLPKLLIESLPKESVIRIPMVQASRSLNLSNAVAIILYEALRQIGFNVLSLK